MTQQVNTRYGRILRNPAIQPVYVVTLDGIPTRFSTLPVTAPLGPTKAYLTAIDGAGSQITVDEGRSSLGNVTFSILDKDGEITYLAFLYQLANRMVTVTTGFVGMPESDYVPVFKGRVLDYTLDSDNVTWSIQTVSLLKDERENIFQAFTKLTAPAGVGDATLTVATTAPFPTATGGVLYLKIGDEVISYTGTTPTTFTGCVRAQLGTVATAHAVNDEVINLAHLQGNPLTLALQILTSTGLGTNGPYDVLPLCCGLGIDQANIDVAKFESERNRWLGGFVFLFNEYEKTSAKAFIEEQLYNFCNAYPTIDNLGRLSIKVYGPPLPTNISTEVTDDTLIGPPTFQGNVLQNYFFNEMDISYDHDFRDGEFKTRTLYEDSNSQVTFDTKKTKTLESRGIHTSVMSQTTVDHFAVRFLKRFAVPSPVLQGKTFFSNRLLELGDIVPLTSAFVPNLATGKIGIQGQLVEIIAISPNYADAMQQYTFLNTGYTYGKKYGAITPTTKSPVNFPVWSAATPVQRNYCFISTKVNNTKGIMSDGSDGYYITA